MIDQANDLRRLVMQAVPPTDEVTFRQVKKVLVAGGKGGVGTTTVAVNLAVAAARQGMRTVLVDADPDGADVQTLCRLRQRHTISDVLEGRRTLVEALQPGPGGITVLPGVWAAADLADASEMSQRRLIDQFAGLATRADLIVLDGGNGFHAFTRRLWQTCEEVVLVTSTDTSAVLDTYAVLKVAFDPAYRRTVHLLVNMCSRAEEAAEVHERIRRSSQRFLGVDLPSCHWLPSAANVVAAGRQGVPFALSGEEAAATRSLLTMVRSFQNAASEQERMNSETRPDPQYEINQDKLPNQLNLGEQNADREEDRSLFARC